MRTSDHPALFLRIDPRDFHSFRSGLMQAYGICDLLESGSAVTVGDGVNIEAVSDLLGQLIDHFDEHVQA